MTGVACWLGCDRTLPIAPGRLSAPVSHVSNGVPCGITCYSPEQQAANLAQLRVDLDDAALEALPDAETRAPVLFDSYGWPDA